MLHCTVCWNKLLASLVSTRCVLRKISTFCLFILAVLRAQDEQGSCWPSAIFASIGVFGWKVMPIFSNWNLSFPHIGLGCLFGSPVMFCLFVFVIGISAERCLDGEWKTLIVGFLPLMFYIPEKTFCNMLPRSVLLKIGHGGAIPPWCGGNWRIRHGKLYGVAVYRGGSWRKKRPDPSFFSNFWGYGRAEPSSQP